MLIKIEDETWSEERLQARLNVSCCAGSLSAMRSVRDAMLAKAGTLFSLGHDDAAKLARDFAKNTNEMILSQEKELHRLEAELRRAEVADKEAEEEAT